MYLTEADVHRALALIGEHFPGAHIALDTGGKFMVDRQHRHPTMKFMAARMQWACDNPRDLESWNIGLQLRTSWTYTQAPRELCQRLPLSYRYLLPALRLLFPPFVTTYRLNLYTVQPHHQ